MMKKWCLIRVLAPEKLIKPYLEQALEISLYLPDDEHHRKLELLQS